MSRYLNAAFYKFCTVENPEAHRAPLREMGVELGIRGTIILAKEGVNSAFAGPEDGVRKLVRYLEENVGLGELDVKESFSDTLPFRRFLVKLKSEIIPLGIDDLDPASNAAAYVSARELKEWLDKNDDLILLDTRNDYEVKLGTFRGAIDPKLKTFRTFTDWIRENFADKKQAKIVTFCTGGIRCEKATAFMRREGFEHVYQLNGGILRYLEETKDAAENHYDGDCFVFDHRVAVNRSLEKSSHALCYACWEPLSEDDLKSADYIPEQQCPHCKDVKADLRKKKQAEGRARHTAKLQERFLRSLETRQAREKKA